MRAITVGKSAKFSVRLSSVGNPDKGQFAPVSNPGTFIGDSVEDCAAACEAYIANWNLGGGNWKMAPVKCGGQVVAFVSYNGRIWTPAEFAASEAALSAIFNSNDAGAVLARKAAALIEAGASDEALDALLEGGTK